MGQKREQMSVDSQTLGVGVVVGTGAGAAASLANTGSPVLLGVVVGVVMLVLLGIATRHAKREIRGDI